MDWIIRQWNKVLLWTPKHGRASIGRPTRTDSYQIYTDIGCSLGDLPGAMDDRDEWRERERVSGKSVLSVKQWWLEADPIKQREMKEKMRKEYLERIRKTSWNQTLLQKFNQRNKYRCCRLCKILWTTLKIDEGSRQMTQRTKKLMTLYKAL